MDKYILIEAMEWFDKVNGNSYFTAKTYVNGELAEVLPFTYGYGSHSKHCAIESLKNKGIIELGERESVYTWE